MYWKWKILAVFSVLITACNQNEYVEKIYNDPAKILNIQEPDTNSIYVCLSPNTYQKVSIELDSNVIFEDSNFTIDFVPAKLIHLQKKSSKQVRIHVKINYVIDTAFCQHLTGVHKLMIGIVDKKNFYYQTNQNYGAWVVD